MSIEDYLLTDLKIRQEAYREKKRKRKMISEWINIIIVIITIVLAWLMLDHLTDYQGRMKEYNAHVCAVNGYMPDCKTPLK